MAGSPEVTNYLATRRTVPAQFLKEPGPDTAQLDTILNIAVRVPDHGKLTPWRFVIYTSQMADEIGARLYSIARAQGDNLDNISEAEEKNWFNFSPVTVGVICAARPHVKIPVIEQTLSAGAVCMNMIHAAHSLGFSAQWVTRWFAYDPLAKAMLGAEDDELFAGFIHIGTPTIEPVERDRPVIARLTRDWVPPDI